MARIDAVIALIFNQNGEVLLHKKDIRYEWGPGEWSFFGGGLESNESPERAIRRELEEELDIHYTSLRFLNTLPYRRKSPVTKRECRGMAHVFYCYYDGPINAIRLKNEGAGFAFFDQSEIKGLNMWSKGKKFLLDYYKRAASGSTIKRP